MNNNDSMRLSAYVKSFGNYIKSDVIRMHHENRIKINGKLPKSLSSFVGINDVVTVDDKVIERVDYVYYLYYKPRGVLSVIDEKPESYINYINSDIKLMASGRLDKDSEGLMILTNDGKYIDFICSPKTHAEKEYIVTLKNDITDEFMDRINKPFVLSKRELKPMRCEKIDDRTVKMILEEGVYHQIRRSVVEAKNTVVNLKRVRINDFKLNDMKPNDLIKIEI